MVQHPTTEPDARADTPRSLDRVDAAATQARASSLQLVPHAAGRALVIRDGLALGGARDDQLSSAEALSAYVEAEGFDVEVVRDGVLALSRARVLHVDVVITALTHSRGSGLDLAEALLEAAPNTQILLLAMTPPSPELRRRIAGLYNVRLLAMSAGREDLMLVVRQAFEGAVGFRGSFFGVSLVDLAQMLNLARRTLSIELSGPMTGALHFVRGELVHAELVVSGPSRGQLGAPHAAISGAFWVCKSGSRAPTALRRAPFWPRSPPPPPIPATVQPLPRGDWRATLALPLKKPRGS